MSLPRRPSHRANRFGAWIAIFAILLAALAPSLARALAPPQEAMPWTEICSVGGPQVAHDAAPASAPARHDGMGFKHCPFCLNQAGAAALPSTPFSWRAPAVDGGACLASAVALPVFRPLRAAAQPRAPPVLS